VNGTQEDQHMLYLDSEVSEGDPQGGYLCGLVEQFSDDPSKAVASLQLVSRDAFTAANCRDLYMLFFEVLAATDAPQLVDLTRHRRWPGVRELYMQLSLACGRSRCGYSLGVPRFAHDLMAAHLRRQADAAAVDFRKISASPESDKSDLEKAAQAVVDAVAAVDVPDAFNIISLNDALHQWMKTESTPKIATGFGPLDDLGGGGLPVGGLSVFAAPPSVGKSALALQAVIGALDLDTDLVALWCMGEMTMEAFARRAICTWSCRGTGQMVSMSAAERRTDYAKESGRALSARLGERLQVLSHPLTVDRIAEHARRSKARLIVVDYVQLVQVGGAADRRSEVDSVVKGLRSLSIESGAAVIAISNISKGVSEETRIGAIGKESSELDYAADLLLLGTAADEPDQSGHKIIRWACKKNRHGECIDMQTTFDGRHQTFTSTAAMPHNDLTGWN